MAAQAPRDEDSTLAILVRQKDESIENLLTRLDEAVRQALEDEVYTDEVNG